VREADKLTTFMCRMSWTSGSLNLLEPSGPHLACYGTPLPFISEACAVPNLLFIFIIIIFISSGGSSTTSISSSSSNSSSSTVVPILVLNAYTRRILAKASGPPHAKAAFLLAHYYRNP